MTANVGQRLPLDITVGFNPVRFAALNNESVYNLFEFEGAMIPTAGFTQILPTLGGQNIEARGIFYSDLFKECIVVIGNTVYAITDTAHRTIGTIATATGKVYFAENGLTTLPSGQDPGGQVAISDGNAIYVATLNNEITVAKDDQGAALEFKPGTLAFQNGFFFANALQSNRIYASNLNDARTFPELFFDQAGGVTRACVAFKNFLYVFAKDITNIFYEQPNLPEFPYESDTSRAWDFGCLAPGSVATSLDIICWLGNTRYGNPTILTSNGGNPQSFSTPGIDALINTFENPIDAEGFIYEEDGHTFYQITFYQDNTTLLYDFYTKKWSALTDVSGSNHSPIRQSAYYEEKNQLLAIHNGTFSQVNSELQQDAKIVEFGVNIFNYDGQIVPRTIITQNYTQDERQLTCNELDLQIEEGENQNESRVCLSISKDRGRTFPINRVRTLEPVGNRKALLRFRNLGTGRWWTFKFDFFSVDRFVIMSATAFVQKR